MSVQLNADAGSAAPAASRLLQAATHSSSSFKTATGALAPPPPPPVFTYDLNAPAQPPAPIYAGPIYAAHAAAEFMAAAPPDEVVTHTPSGHSSPPPPLPSKVRGGPAEDANRPSSRLSGRGVWNPMPVSLASGGPEGENHQNERMAPGAPLMGTLTGPVIATPNYNESLLQPAPPESPQQQPPVSPGGPGGPKNKKQSKEEKKREKEEKKHEKEMKKREKEAQKAAKKGTYRSNAYCHLVVCHSAFLRLVPYVGVCSRSDALGFGAGAERCGASRRRRRERRRRRRDARRRRGGGRADPAHGEHHDARAALREPHALIDPARPALILARPGARALGAGAPAARPAAALAGGAGPEAGHETRGGRAARRRRGSVRD